MHTDSNPLSAVTTVQERTAIAADRYPLGSSVATIVHSIGGRQERVSGTVVDHRRGQVAVQTDGHGCIMVALDNVEILTDAPALPEYPCDICDMEVVEGERFTVSDGGLTVEHTACTADWFRRNYGREGLA